MKSMVVTLVVALLLQPPQEWLSKSNSISTIPPNLTGWRSPTARALSAARLGLTRQVDAMLDLRDLRQKLPRLLANKQILALRERYDCHETAVTARDEVISPRSPVDLLSM